MRAASAYTFTGAAVAACAGAEMVVEKDLEEYLLLKEGEVEEEEEEDAADENSPPADELADELGEEFCGDWLTQPAANSLPLLCVVRTSATAAAPTLCTTPAPASPGHPLDDVPLAASFCSSQAAVNQRIREDIAPTADLAIRHLLDLWASDPDVSNLEPDGEEELAAMRVAFDTLATWSKKHALRAKGASSATEAGGTASSKRKRVLQPLPVEKKPVRHQSSSSF
ncbi:hypothetical protein BDK51DRAFT_52777 [Blyttiomyces helicus]|uniref:Uncharacterized protein n=1 Tax=Blyttiomyces helicus TaxID=388810 RepID=A0A4P9W1U6_9FUNG|nr:hypothetical protein BDK51DRAFT_52777 [Blyttiomyces helicus]|eukprot:RKO86084.1 hypothetical protein BDK51DRAFT_52777 [Blyttiomyces helicus]